RFAALGFALRRNLLGQAFVGDNDEVIACVRHAGQAEYLHRNRWSRTVDLTPGFVEQRAHAAILDAGDDEVALLQRALLDEDRRDRAAALVETRLDDDAGGARVLDGLELHDFGLQQDRVE